MADTDPTPVQTGDYTASPGDFVPVDASGGSITITLPAAPVDQAQVGVKVIAIAPPNIVIVECGGSDTLDSSGGPVDVTLDSLNEGIFVQYQASTDIWYALATAVSLDVASGAAKLGTDGHVGGPSGSPLSNAVALVSSPNVFGADADNHTPIVIKPHSPAATAPVFQMTDASAHPLVWIEPSGRLQLNDTAGNDHDVNNAALNIDQKWHAISMTHSVDWASQSNGGNDLEDSTHRSLGDCHFMTHLGGVVPNYSFTATSDGAGHLSAVSGFNGLYKGAQFRGPGAQVLTVTAANVQAQTLSYSGAVVGAGSGLAFSYSTPSDTGSGGDGTLNVEVPYWLDHIAGNASSAPPGGILNNRTGQTQILAQVQPVATGQPGYNLSYQSNSQAIRILNGFTAAGTTPADGTNVGLQISNFSTGPAIQIVSHTALTGRSAALVISDAAGDGMPAIRVNDSSDQFGFLMLSDGTFQAGQRPSSVTIRATIRDFVAGISDTLRLVNSGASSVNAEGDGAQLLFGIGLGGTNAGKIQGVMDQIGPKFSGSLRFSIQTRGGAIERLRLSAAGIGVFTKVSSPAAQQNAAGVTTGYRGGSGTPVTIDGTFKGSTGAAAYTIGDLVTALKAYGLLVQ